jgi:5-(carboxyamino)imidazole ribonucleotide mutase
MPRVGIVMGSDSDLELMAKAAEVLEELGIESELSIISAHRCPEEAAEYAKSAASRGLEAIIAGAGLAAHLPGVLAAFTHLPVIGVPLKAGALAGVDALYAIVQMPPGVPVATVGIDATKNAGILAAQILSIGDPGLTERLRNFKEKLRLEVTTKSNRLHTIGYQNYLAEKKK